MNVRIYVSKKTQGNVARFSLKAFRLTTYDWLDVLVRFNATSILKSLTERSTSVLRRILRRFSECEQDLRILVVQGDGR